MAATQDTLTLVANTWTLLASADITAMRAQNMSPDMLYLQGTVGATPPTSISGAIQIQPHKGITTDDTLAKLWPGVAATRIYGMIAQGGDVSRSHG